MTRDEIIKMAREAGIHVYPEFEAAFEHFAALIASAEREACAKVCDSRYMGDNTREDMEAKRCARDIRARKN